MIKKLFSIIILLLAFQSSKSQDLHTGSKKATDYYEKASQYFNAKSHLSARDNVLKALDIDSNFVEAWFLLGNIYATLDEPNKALSAYDKQMQLMPDYNKVSYYYAGKIAFSLQEFQKAEALITKFLSYPDNSKRSTEECIKLKRDAAFAKDAILKPSTIEFKNLGYEVNSNLSEYTPAITADNNTLIFTRLVVRQEDFFTSTRTSDSTWSKAVPLKGAVNTPMYNEGAQSLSPDGETLFLTICGRDDSKGKCDIYISTKQGNAWSVPTNLGSPVNTVFQERQPAVSADGKTLFFISDRMGGLGGEDIWTSTYSGEGKWTEPVNLGATVNTKDNEESPFIHPDNQTLYYSSDGWPGMGGKDLFFTKRSINGAWQQPQNLGYPINSSGDERSIIITRDGLKGIVSSSTAKGFGGFDIFEFELPSEVKPNPVTFVKAKVFDKASINLLEARAEIIDVETNQTLLITKSNGQTGEFLACLPAGKEYALNVSASGYLFYSDNFNIKEVKDYQPFQLEVPLQKIVSGEIVVLKNIFFNSGSAELNQNSKAELEKIAQFMKANIGTTIELGGHTDNTGTENLNKQLSLQRANSVKAALINLGIEDKRISTMGYGASMPLSTNDTEEGKFLNRRTELKIL